MYTDYSKLTGGELANLLETGDLSPVIFVHAQVNKSGLMAQVKRASPSFYEAYESRMRVMNDSELAAFLKNNILCGNVPIKNFDPVNFENADCESATAIAFFNNRKKFEKRLI